MEDQICDWGSGLPNHLLYCVLEKIDSSKDFLRFGCVCRNWRSTVKEYVAKERVDDTPMMLLVGDERDSHALWAFDVAAGRFLRSKLSVPYRKRFCGSSHGWLAAVNDDWSVTLYKPFSSSATEIKLPPVYPPPAEYLVPESVLPRFQPYHVRKLVITADPIENRDECMVVAAVWNLEDLAVFRVGRDSAWSRVRCPGDRIPPHDLILLRGTSRVYTVGYIGDVRSVDLEHMDRDSVVVRLPDQETYKIEFNNYLVQSRCGKTIYLVQRFFKKRPAWIHIGRSTSRFEVSALDLATGKLNRVTSIGDNNALFLGDNSSACVKASPAYLPNCIYFNQDLDSISSSRWETRDMGIYDIQTNKFKVRYRIPESTYQAMGKRPPIFVLPTLTF